MFFYWASSSEFPLSCMCRCVKIEPRLTFIRATFHTLQTVECNNFLDFIRILHRVMIYAMLLPRVWPSCCYQAVFWVPNCSYVCCCCGIIPPLKMMSTWGTVWVCSFLYSPLPHGMNMYLNKAVLKCSKAIAEGLQGAALTNIEGVL